MGDCELLERHKGGGRFPSWGTDGDKVPICLGTVLLNAQRFDFRFFSNFFENPFFPSNFLNFQF